jgi:CO/xanthine dehydrogenase FAD-binding subunit
MAPLEYHRPQSLEAALGLLKEGVPLGGGTALTPRRHGHRAVIDLQDLGLDGFEVTADAIRFGATFTLQAVVEAASQLPSALVRACRLEAGWNIRNQATLAGTVLSADGRSPLLTTLLGMGAELEIATSSGPTRIPLAEALSARSGQPAIGLITDIHARRPDRLAYEQVARSPVDRPQVCAAAAYHQGSKELRVALGGYGPAPRLIHEERGAGPSAVETASDAARDAYVGAGDAWASAEYRAAVARTLVGRVVREVLA